MPLVGVVVPTLNEARYLPGLLQDLRQLTPEPDLVVADGGSTDGTVDLARNHGARIVEAVRGRGPQMNAGARVLRTRWLCFLHADTRLDSAALADLERTVRDPDACAAVWRLAIDAPGFWYRTLEAGAWMRDRLCGFPYGDQGLLIRRDRFKAIGGFADVPILEDVAMVRTLRRQCRVLRLASAVHVSPRRWQREGPYRAWLRNSVLLAAYLAGVSPLRLARWYRPEPE